LAVVLSREDGGEVVDGGWRKLHIPWHYVVAYNINPQLAAFAKLRKTQYDL